MISIKRLASALCLAICFSSPSNAQNISDQITQYNMGDDGHVSVPLPFPFPFYGQTFNDSWMYDNGVVSFKQPGTQGALNPWQWSSQPFSNNMNGSYFISPLWADIAPKWGVTSYTTQTDGSYMKYNWNNISEYYSGGTRLSTFSLTIRPDGTFNADYINLNLNTSNIAVGYVGDPTKGEYTQTYYAPYGTNIQNETIANWSGYTLLPPPQYPTQCTTNPLYSTECPGYNQALALQNSTVPTTVTPTITTVANETIQTDIPASVVPTTSVTPESTTTITTTAPTPIASVSPTPSTSTPSVSTSTTPTANNPQPKVGEVSQSGGSSNRPTTSQILSIVAGEQSRIASVERSAVEQTTQQANAASSNSTQQAETIASQSQSQSITSSIQASQQTLQSLIIENSSQLGISTNTISSTISSTTSYGQLNIDSQQYNNSGLRINESQPSNENVVYLNRNIQNEELSRFDISKQTSNNSERELIEQNSISLQREINQDSPSVSVNQKTKDNELAGGISLALLVKQPIGFENYMSIIPDVKFYVPKEIYKGQQTVDNRRASRGLFGANDSRHAEMVNQQYGR
jgi:hypothetical protein